MDQNIEYKLVLLWGVFIWWNGTVEWNGGNGTVEWNSGMDW